MHPCEYGVAGLAVAHQPLVHLEEIVSSNRIVQVCNLLFNKTLAPTDMEWTSALPVTIELTYVVAGVYVERRKDTLILSSKSPKKQRDVVCSGHTVGGVAALARSIRTSCCFQRERLW